MNILLTFPIFISVIYASLGATSDQSGIVGSQPCELRPEITPHTSGVTTDEDGRIWLIRAQSNSVPFVQIGTAVSNTALQRSEADVIPKDEITTERQQFTCKKSGWRLVALVSVKSAEDDDGHLSYENVLRVVLFHGSDRKTILTKRYSRINKIAIDNLTGDGFPEIGVQWSDGPANVVDMWKIDGKGELNEVDLKNIYDGMDAPFASNGNSVDWGLPRAQNFSLVSEQRIVEAAGRVRRIRKYYKWNSEQGRYVFTSKGVAEEHILQK